MLYREIIAVCSEIHTKHMNTLCGLKVEFVNVEPGGTYSDHWALQGCSHLSHVRLTWIYLRIQSVPRSKHTPPRL
jgi:hypothetical protein